MRARELFTAAVIVIATASPAAAQTWGATDCLLIQQFISETAEEMQTTREQRSALATLLRPSLAGDGLNERFVRDARDYLNNLPSHTGLRWQPPEIVRALIRDRCS